MFTAQATAKVAWDHLFKKLLQKLLKHMKLLNLSFTKPRYWVLGLALAAGAGTSQAQFTGIGTVAPSGALHVVGNDTTAAATANTLIVEKIKRILPTAADSTLYNSTLVYNPATGIFRYQKISSLLNNNAEWIWDGTKLVPRRVSIADEISIVDNTVGIGNNLTVGGNATVTGNGAITGTLAVTGNGTFTNNLTVNGNTALATGAGDVVTLTNLTRIPLASVGAGIHVMIRDTANANQIRYAELGNLLEANGMWVENAGKTELLPRVSNYAGTIGITTDSVLMKKAASVTGGFRVRGATELRSTLDVVAATNLRSTLSVGTLTNATPPLGADKVLIQKALPAGNTLVQHVTVDQLIQNNGEWRVNDLATPTYIYAFRARGGSVPAASDVTITTATGNMGIGTVAPTQKLQIVGGSILVDSDQGINFGAAAKSLRGVGAALELRASATYSEAIVGAHTMTAAQSTKTIAGDLTSTSTTGNVITSAAAATAIITNRVGTGAAPLSPTTTLNQHGLGIGTVAIPGRHLQTNLADGIQLGSLTAVTNVTTVGLGPVTPGLFERVLLTDGNGVVRYINASDLTQASGEWRFRAAVGGTNPDLIYANRADANGQRIVATTGGNFGIGTQAPSEKLQIVGGNIQLDLLATLHWGSTANQITNTGITSSGAYRVQNGAETNVGFFEGASTTPWLFHKADFGTAPGNEIGRVGINTNTPAATLHVAGNIVASNTAVTSDRRFKDNITELTGALNAVNALRGVTYKFRTDEFPKEHFDRASHIGFIAQELRDVLPMAVFERTDGFLTVDYGAVTPVLVEAIQELSAKVDRLEAENAALRSGKIADAVGAVSTKQLRDLEARLAAMDARLEAAAAGRK